MLNKNEKMPKKMPEIKEGDLFFILKIDKQDRRLVLCLFIMIKNAIHGEL